MCVRHCTPGCTCCIRLSYAERTALEPHHFLQKCFLQEQFKDRAFVVRHFQHYTEVKKPTVPPNKIRLVVVHHKMERYVAAGVHVGCIRSC